MKTHKKYTLSSCCGFTTIYANGSYMCRKCRSITTPVVTKVEVLKKIGDGHYRSVNNKGIGIKQDDILNEKD